MAGIKALEMPVEDLLIDIYYHFNQRLVVVMKKFNFYTCSVIKITADFLTLCPPIIQFLIFFYSSKREETYIEYMDFCDIEPLQILKHVTTRWLSLQKCVTRIIHQWASLKSYFNSHEDVEKEGRVKRATFW